ncbi:hypothetical protein O181_040861 [Austropuccinia psidii MF-1]|uniref:Uncharacterized protein n=1 Tax=Austropuccinia psidii MF-1 TaxID=1389203 RepID=A0A9Q3HDS6_9BASI|nr:hypothetical protein [Austropuccinia psidii MF-1]
MAAWDLKPKTQVAMLDGGPMKKVSREPLKSLILSQVRPLRRRPMIFQLTFGEYLSKKSGIPSRASLPSVITSQSTLVR